MDHKMLLSAVKKRMSDDTPEMESGILGQENSGERDENSQLLAGTDEDKHLDSLDEHSALTPETGHETEHETEVNPVPERPKPIHGENLPEEDHESMLPPVSRHSGLRSKMLASLKGEKHGQS